MTEKERQRKISEYHEAHPESCWAGLVHWVTLGDEDEDGDFTFSDAADSTRCKEESEECPRFSCYCGQYQHGELMPKK